MSIELTKIEKSELQKRVDNFAVPADYFRSNLFLPTTKINSVELKKMKKIYENKTVKIEVDRELGQHHRDLFTTLLYENHSNFNKDGSFYVETNFYDLAKKMGYKNPKGSVSLIKEMLYDMSKTMIKITKNRNVFSHILLGHSMYNKDTGKYVVHIPAQTAKYIANEICFSIPKDVNDKIVSLPSKFSKMKALISYMLSNRSANIGFETICKKFDITSRNGKYKFKKMLNENLELLNSFGITFVNDTFKLHNNLYFIYPNKDAQTTQIIEKAVEKVEVEQTVVKNEVTPQVMEAVEKICEGKSAGYYATILNNYINNDEVTVATVKKVLSTSKKVDNTKTEQEIVEQFKNHEIEINGIEYIIQYPFLRQDGLYVVLHDKTNSRLAEIEYKQLAPFLQAA